MVLQGAIEPGDRVTVGVHDGNLHFEVERGGAADRVGAAATGAAAT
jgi:hypothetical protein